MKGEAGGGGHRNQHWETNEKLSKVTNEERQGGRRTQQQARMEIINGGRMKGDKAAAIMKGDKWREMQGDKAAASRPFSDFGDRQPSHWEVRTPYSFQLSGKRRETNEGRSS